MTIQLISFGLLLGLILLYALLTRRTTLAWIGGVGVLLILGLLSLLYWGLIPNM